MRTTPTEGATRALVLAGWVAAVAATQAWPPWSAGIRQQFATDISSYTQIARAAPGFPTVRLPEQHAQRFPLHWLVGVISNGTGDLHLVYRIATLLCLLGTLAVVHRLLVRARLSLAGYALCSGALIASAYPVRYLLAAPGMLSDAAFILGLALVVLALVEHRAGATVAGLAFATLARQTALPVAVVAAAVLWRRGRRAVAAVTLAVPILLFVAERQLTARFSIPELGSITSFTVLGSLDHPIRLTDHVGRLLLGSAVPLGLIGGAYLRTRRLPPLSITLVTAAVVLQPLVLAPGWVGHNEPRLVALSLPALIAMGALILGDARIGMLPAALGAAGIFAASLHARYSAVGVPGDAAWAVLLLLGAGGLAAVLATTRLRVTARDGSAPAPTGP